LLIIRGLGDFDECSKGNYKKGSSKIYITVAVLAFLVGFSLLGVYYYNTTILTPQPQEPETTMQDTSQLNTYLSTLPIQELNETEWSAHL